jgi:RND superfamily putative drug exporter
VLLPAFMHVMGEWNWWAPKWMTKLHNRIGLEEGFQTERPVTFAPNMVEQMGASIIRRSVS